jgi:hypothetical protein
MVRPANLGAPVRRVASLGAVALMVACVGIQDGLPPVPAISGLAPWHPLGWVVVRDGRLPGDDRLGLVRHDATQGTTYRHLDLDDRRLPDGHLADIESVAALPDRPHEFLLLESGSHAPGAPLRRRLVQVAIEADAATVRLTAIGDVSLATAMLDNCEALLCWAHAGQVRVLLADRGKEAHTVPFVTGTLRSSQPTQSRQDLTLTVEESATAELGTLTGPGARACAELLLAADDTIWSVSTVDPGTSGPFRSVISRVGHLDRTSGWPAFHAPVPAYRLDGFKVEGLAQDAAGQLWIAVDDEGFGGALRPLPAAN